jgi:hypothetical protein
VLHLVGDKHAGKREQTEHGTQMNVQAIVKTIMSDGHEHNIHGTCMIMIMIIIVGVGIGGVIVKKQAPMMPNKQQTIKTYRLNASGMELSLSGM